MSDGQESVGTDLDLRTSKRNRILGNQIEITDILLGQGAYGGVYLAKDENNNNFAVKCCNATKYGIPNILETSIMTGILHPYLNSALRIQATESRLYITQEAALTDLAYHTRSNKNNYKPNVEELRKWCACLAQAVEALHENNIIHADIKSSNVLLYEDGNVKLTDYTLATKKWKPTDKFKHKICTSTHRPLECLLGQNWDESVDIWSLGCTFYEIAYQSLLFPYQGMSDDSNLKKGEQKKNIKDRSINCILKWARDGPNSESLKNTDFDINYRDINFYSYELPPEFSNPEMVEFNDLLLKMLYVDPKKRLKIEDVLKHPFFKNINPKSYLVVTRPKRSLDIPEHARVTRHIHRFTNDINVQNLAFDIYSKIPNKIDITEQLRVMTSVWIAAKIIIGIPPDDNPEISKMIHKILLSEREICHMINFHLHS